MSSNFEALTDEELVALARKQDDAATEFLLQKYAYIVKREARTVYIIGAEPEDIIQEGTIGLFKAIRDYDNSKETSFSTFATLCVKNQIVTAIKTSNRLKHIPLNSYTSIYADENEDNQKGNADIKDESVNANPEKALLEKEEHKDMMERIKKELSPFENKVVNLYLSGMSHEDIGKNLGKTRKSIDNALSRIRAKLSK